jgi:hypothetical protein
MASSQLAARAVGRLHGWLARGVQPRHVLVVTPSWTSAKFMEALIDTSLPLGAYEVNVRSEDALASEVVAAHAPQLRRNRVAPAVTRALLQRMLPSLPLPPGMIPKHDPARFAGEVYALFRDLAASGVPAMGGPMWDHVQAVGTPDQVAVMRAYAEWLATKERSCRPARPGARRRLQTFVTSTGRCWWCRATRCRPWWPGLWLTCLRQVTVA